MKVSVIIPAYNVAPYIENTIKSVIKQTFDDFEVIAVDDGSKDNTGEICDQLCSIYSKLRVIHQENGGVSAARRHGLEKSKGEWIMFLDGDDILPSDSLSVLYAHTNKGVDIVNGVCAHIDNAGYILTCERPVGEGLIRAADYQKQLSMMPKAHHGFLYRRELFKNAPVVNREIVNNEDQLMNLIIASRIQNAYCVNKIVHHYLERDNSISHKVYPEKYWYYFFSYVEDNYNIFGIPKIVIDRYRLYRLLSLVRNEKELNIDFKLSTFKSLRELHFSKKWGIKGNLCLAFIKHPSSILLFVIRIHPSNFISKKKSLILV